MSGRFASAFATASLALALLLPGAAEAQLACVGSPPLRIEKGPYRTRGFELTSEEFDIWLRQTRAACVWGAIADPLPQYLTPAEAGALYSGVGSCDPGEAVTATVAGAAPTCGAVAGGSPTRTRTVCASGCDYTDVSDALAFVAAQPRNATTRWLVILYHAGPTSSYDYTEAATVAVPSFTALQGAMAGVALAGDTDQNIGILSTVTTGSSFTFGEQAEAINLNLASNGNTLTGNHTVVSTADNVNFRNVYITQFNTLGAFTSDALFCSANVFVGDAVYVNSFQTGAASRAVAVTGTCSMTLYRSRVNGGTTTLVENTGTGTLRLFQARLDGSPTTQLVNSGAGALHAIGTSYTTSSGAIDHGAMHAETQAVDGDLTVGGALACTDCVALGADTSGGYAAGDAEAGAALTGDSATAFFSSGTVEAARLPAVTALASACTDAEVLGGTAAGTGVECQAAAGGGIGGSTGTTDNAIARADGTGAATLQGSNVTIADLASSNVTIAPFGADTNISLTVAPKGNKDFHITGAVRTADYGNDGNMAYGFTSDATSGIWFQPGTALNFRYGGTDLVSISSNGLRLRGGDVGFDRSAAGVAKVTNGGSGSGALQFPPMSAAPVTCGSADTAGVTYYDSDSNELCLCDGTSWTGLKAGGTCA